MLHTDDLNDLIQQIAANLNCNCFERCAFYRNLGMSVLIAGFRSLDMYLPVRNGMSEQVKYSS